MPFLPPNQQRQSTEGSCTTANTMRADDYKEIVGIRLRLQSRQCCPLAGNFEQTLCLTAGQVADMPSRRQRSQIAESLTAEDCTCHSFGELTTVIGELIVRVGDSACRQDVRKAPTCVSWPTTGKYDINI